MKAGAYQNIVRIDAPDVATVIFHLKKPDASFLANLCDGAIGIVPQGSGRDFWQHPLGSGPFIFVSQQIDRDVRIRRNDQYWQTPPSIQNVRFAVVPDATTRALELEKGSADVTVNALPPDMVRVLSTRPELAVESGPGTVLNYITINMRDPLLADVRVRSAIAMAINRPLIVRSLFEGHARLAESLLPPEHWAWNPGLKATPFDPASAEALLEAAGYPRKAGGVRFHLSMKTSTDETTRLLAAIIQQQLAAIGIALDLRSYEFATFYADLTRGAFQLAPSRWIGGNEAPDIFRYAYASSAFPPHGANRGFYQNSQVDRLLTLAAAAATQAEQITAYRAVQQTVAHDRPTIYLWYMDSVVVHNRRLSNVQPSPSGAFDFLRVATLAP